jgi:DNA-binding IclR family transcriptional regulator
MNRKVTKLSSARQADIGQKARARGVSWPLAASPMPKQRAGRKGIQSIEIGFRILDFLVQAGRPVALREIAAATALPPSNVHFYLVSLTEVGAVRQDPDARHYSLGPYALRLGIAGLEQFDLLAAAKSALQELANDAGHSAFLGVWGNHGPTIVYRVDGQQSRSVFELRIGSVLPVLRSALGRNLLAHLPASMTNPFVEKELADINAMAPNHIDPELPRSRREVNALIDQMRREGLSRSRRTLLSDYTAISAPVFDYSGTIIAGITVMGPIGILDDDFKGPVAEKLRTVSRKISAEAGHSAEKPPA